MKRIEFAMALIESIKFTVGKQELAFLFLVLGGGRPAVMAKALKRSETYVRNTVKRLIDKGLVRNSNTDPLQSPLYLITDKGARIVNAVTTAGNKLSAVQPSINKP